ncbi:hypothetical protein Tco_0920553 [Tanacetum coccineum]
MNQNFYEPNLCYNSNSFGFDQFQPSQFPVIYQPPQETSTEMLQARENLMEAIQAFLKEYDQIPPKEKSMALLLANERFLKIKQALVEEQNQPENIQELLLELINDLQILNGIQLKQEEQAAKVIAIAPDLPIMDSLIMEDEHLNTILETESDKENESSVKDLNITPNQNEGLDDIVSIPPGKEIDHLDAIPDSVQSLFNRANTIVFLIEEFARELAPIDPIPPGIVEAEFDLEEDIRLIEKLLNGDSSPYSPEELNFEIPDAIIESFSPYLIPIEDSDSIMEEIDIFLAPDDSIPLGIENDDYDSEGDVLFLEELLNDDSISLPKYESFHVDFYNVPSSPRPPEKPPDDDVYFDIEPDTGVLTTKVVDDISTRELYVYVPNILPTLYPVFDTLLPFSSENEDKVFNLGILISKEKKTPHLLSHRGFKVFPLINDSESPMMIYGGDIPILDVSYLHFYPILDGPNQDCLDFEDSRARPFVLRSLELQILSMLISGIQYPRFY